MKALTRFITAAIFTLAAFLLSAAHAQSFQMLAARTSDVVFVSGTPIRIDNKSGVTLPTFGLKVTGSPGSLSTPIQGCVFGDVTGDNCATLETNTSTATPQIRHPSTNNIVYDYFLVTPTWTGGTSPTVTVNSTLSPNARNGGGLGATTALQVTALFSGCSGVQLLGFDGGCHDATNVNLASPGCLGCTTPGPVHATTIDGSAITILDDLVHWQATFWRCNPTAPASPGGTGYFGIGGCTSTGATSFFAQPSTTPPAANNVWLAGAPAGNGWFPLSWGKVTSAYVDGSVCAPGSFAAQTDAATVTWAVGSLICANASLTFTAHGGSRTLNLTGLVNGGSYVLSLKQDATGGEGLTLGTGCTWKVSGAGAGAITPSSGANAIDILAFTYDGTNCYANFNKNFT